MDGLFHGKPYEQMDDLVVKIHNFWRASHIISTGGLLDFNHCFLGVCKDPIIALHCWWLKSQTTTVWMVLKPHKHWDKLPINWCRISAINSKLNSIVNSRKEASENRDGFWSNLIATDLAPKWWWKVREMGPRLFQGNLGWWNIIIWPD